MIVKENVEIVENGVYIMEMEYIENRVYNGKIEYIEKKK